MDGPGTFLALGGAIVDSFASGASFGRGVLQAVAAFGGVAVGGRRGLVEERFDRQGSFGPAGYLVHYGFAKLFAKASERALGENDSRVEGERVVVEGV